MNLRTLKVIYNCLALLLVADVLISYFLKDSLDPDIQNIFVITGVVLIACAIIVRILIFRKR
ncbi:MAG: hypothetical protein PHH63_04760 [Bacteroidales bacterium]|jgi:hypothetical protein|nr:hypothetical protein [Bacteroidales bacterium]